MKKVFTLLCFLLALSYAYAQTDDLSGSVRDSIGNKPLAGVSVFLNSTSKGTVTRADGSFLLKDFPKGKYELVVSAIGYETFVLEVSSSHLPPSLKITLRQKATELEAFVVEPYLKDGWQRYGQFFLDNFIGKMDNASSCTIKNRKVLRFHFYKKSNRLTVTATEPLMIQNGALGYTLQFKLEEFACDFSTNIVFSFGYPYFQEMPTKREGQRRRWAAHRQEAYLGSVVHFMRSLYQGTCWEASFTMLHDEKLPNLEKRRVKEIYHPDFQRADSFSIDTLHHFWEVLRQPDFFTRTALISGDSLITVYPDSTKSLFFDGRLKVVFGNPQKGIAFRESEILLVTPAMVIVQENGSYFPPQEILVSGYWGRSEKISNLLPLNYALP